MPDISTELSNIMNARYGKDVRKSIHDGIKKVNDNLEDVGVDELLDVRKGADNKTYASAGDAVRKQGFIYKIFPNEYTKLSQEKEMGVFSISSTVTPNIMDLPDPSYSGRIVTLENKRIFDGAHRIQTVYITQDMLTPYVRFINSEDEPVTEWLKINDFIYDTGIDPYVYNGTINPSDLKNNSLYSITKIGTFGVSSDATIVATDIPEKYKGKTLFLSNQKGFNTYIVQTLFSSSEYYMPYTRIINTDGTGVYNNNNWIRVDPNIFFGFRGNLPNRYTALSDVTDIGIFTISSVRSPDIPDLPDPSYSGRAVTLENKIMFTGSEYAIQTVYITQDMLTPYVRSIDRHTNYISEWKKINIEIYRDEDDPSTTNEYKNALSDYKWCACGDSFTHGDFSGSEDVLIKEGKYEGQLAVYPYLIGNRNGMTVYNIAVNGLRMAGDDGFAKNKLGDIPSDSDFITIALGINDLPNHKNSPLGTIDDETTDTFYGAWNVTMKYLYENFPSAHIGLIVTNGITFSQRSYSDAIIDIAKKWCVPYLNQSYGEQVPTMNRSSKDPSSVSSIALSARNNIFGVNSRNSHPNAKAHEYESIYIEQWLMTI